jgi:hypothetical protein
MTYERNTITVSIGRNVPNQNPLTDMGWRRFQHDTTRALRNLDADIHFSGTGKGYFQGQTEESATWVATIVSYKLPTLRLALKAIAKTWSQDCIALTIGQTEFVG